MRLVSCIGLLMVIPAIALLTTKTHPDQLDTAEIRKQDKTSSITQTMPADSVQRSKATEIHPAAKNHLEFTAGSAVKPNPVLTKK